MRLLCQSFIVSVPSWPRLSCTLPQPPLGERTGHISSRNRIGCILAVKADIWWQLIVIIFVRINLPNFVQFTKKNTIRTIQSHSGDQVRPGQSPPEAESIWPQSSANPKYGKQTVATAITTTTQCYVEIVTVMLGIIEPT